MSNLNDILFCVLSKSFNPYYINLTKFLSSKNINTFILRDDQHYADTSELINYGFKNINNIGHRFGSVIAWDKIFYYIYSNNLLCKYKYFYFIEDDVYAKNINYFYDLIIDWQKYNVDFITKNIISKNNSPYWSFWRMYPSLSFSNPHKSLNCLCRLSSSLVDLIINYAITNRTFIFQEILFASLCVEYKLTNIEYTKLYNQNKYLAKIVWSNKSLNKKDIESQKIYHPEKNICLE